MKNFDQNKRGIPVDAADRQFQLANQVWTIRRRVRPEVLGLLDAVAAADGLGDVAGGIDNLITQLLVGPDRERWELARGVDDDENTIELEDLQEVMAWALEVLGHRPLELPESSGDGSATQGIVQQLRGASSSPEAVPSAS